MAHSMRLAMVTAGLVLLVMPAPARAEGDTEWPEYGGDAGGLRYSAVADVTPQNVRDLEVAWTWSHEDYSDRSGKWAATSAYELTPILVDDTLYGCTPMNRVFALDPRTGAERWIHDPQIDPKGRYANQLICRGVAAWLDPQRGEGAACRRRIFTATNDARLIALDAADGKPCADFGQGGQLLLKKSVQPERWLGEYQVTSAPTVVGDLVVVGSAVSDNSRVNAPSGVVRAYDVRSGVLRWAWDLRPPDTPAPADGSYTPGTPNVWAPMSADPERDLLYVPTGNPSPDYYRGAEVPPRDHYGSAVVALRASTGEVVWHFQTVHHDLWDYDAPAQPTLFPLKRQGKTVPAVVQPTKMGLLFIMDRATGEHVFGVEERPVPQGPVPGETLSPTQPFPLKPPPLIPHVMSDAWGMTPFDKHGCRKQMEGLRNDGIYTPPTLEGSIIYPGNAGGSNWGGVAVDPERQLLVANTMDLAWVVRLVPREEYEALRRAGTEVELAPQDGTPYAMSRRGMLSVIGIPCNPPPWGTLAAVDLSKGEIRWQVPLGTVRDIAPLPIPWKLGTPNLGGPLVTGGGLIFIGAAMDDYLRAFDVESGEELWKGRLPAGGQATPMTYRLDGRQYVVIAAGGHGRAGTRLGGHLLAYALPE
jgi:quinoprotein glucose dehydrogenase